MKSMNSSKITSFPTKGAIKSWLLLHQNRFALPHKKLHLKLAAGVNSVEKSKMWKQPPLNFPKPPCPQVRRRPQNTGGRQPSKAFDFQSNPHVEEDFLGQTLGSVRIGIDWVGWVCLLVGFALWMFLCADWVRCLVFTKTGETKDVTRSDLLFACHHQKGTTSRKDDQQPLQPSPTFVTKNPTLPGLTVAGFFQGKPL